MNSVKRGLTVLGLFLVLAGQLSACGQKGPLIVEKAETIQEEENESTK